MGRQNFNKKNIDNIKDAGLKNLVRSLWLEKGKNGIKIVQHALNMIGADLMVDGWFGKKSTAALVSFDIADINVSIGLAFDQMSENKEPRYITIARNEIGTKEIKGKRHNKRVLEYHSKSTGKYKNDEVPWCGSFIAWVLYQSDIQVGILYPERAKAWAKFGRGIDEPSLGAIAVKSRRGGGHVCFVVGKSKTGKYLYCLGGNQSDAVNIRKYRADVFSDFRLPKNQEAISLPILNKKIKIATKEN